MKGIESRLIALEKASERMSGEGGDSNTDMPGYDPIEGKLVVRSDTGEITIFNIPDNGRGPNRPAE